MDLFEFGSKHDNMKIGEFLVENGIITGDQLSEALELQGDNKERIVGEILVTQGVLSKEELIMAMEMYMMITGADAKHVDEWLDQEEIDLLIDRFKDKPTPN
jgi:hypothetical protein